MNTTKFAAIIYDDIAVSDIVCPLNDAVISGAPGNCAQTMTCDNIPVSLQDAPCPIANSTMLDEGLGCADADHATHRPAPPPLPAPGPSKVSETAKPQHAQDRGLKVGPCEYAYIIQEVWPSVNLQLEGSHHLLDIYTAVRDTALPNYLSARIPIPSQINCDAWDHLLQGYADAEIADFLRFGWPGGYTAPSPPTPSQTNHPSALNFPNDVQRFLDKEVALGAMLGPFPVPPFGEWSQVSPLMTVEKKDSSARRVIIDLSFPLGLSVNSGVPKNLFQGKSRQYTLPTIHNLAELVISMGRGSLIWKADLERAYRQLRCDPLDYPLMGVRHQGKYYTDICPSFGCRGSSMSQQRVSEAVCHLMAREGHAVLAYVDDFCGIHSSPHRAQAAYAAFTALTKTLGLKLADDKCAPPSSRMEWLGFVFDTQEMTITLPPEKLGEIIGLATAWSAKRRASRHDLQSLAGKLNHISQCILPARKFMGRILAALRSAPLSGWIPVDDHLRRDVAWFVRYARQCNGRLLLRDTLPTYEIQCDACLEGGGGFSSTHYYSVLIPKPMTEEHHISRLEAINIVLAIKTLVPANMRSTEIVITTDNSAAMHTLNTGKTRDPVLAACSRELWLFAAVRELRITVNHAPGATLVLADALSRRHKAQEYEDIVVQMTRHLNLHQLIPCDFDSVLTPDL